MLLSSAIAVSAWRGTGTVWWCAAPGARPSCCCAGWWVWADAVTVSVAVAKEAFQPLTLAPGLVATLAILVMNCVPRSEVSSDNIYGDDAALVSTHQCRGDQEGSGGTEGLQHDWHDRCQHGHLHCCEAVSVRRTCTMCCAPAACVQCRNRLTLFIAYVFSFAAIAGAVAILLQEKAQQSSAPDASENLWTGAVSVEPVFAAAAAARGSAGGQRAAGASACSCTHRPAQAGIIQACLIVASGVVVWLFRDSDDDSGYGYL